MPGRHSCHNSSLPRQQPAELMNQVLETVRSIPAPGFQEVTREDSEEMMQEGNTNDVEEGGESGDAASDAGETEQRKVMTPKLSLLLGVFTSLQEMSQDIESESGEREQVIGVIESISRKYQTQYNERVNARQQSLITRFLSQRRPAKEDQQREVEVDEDIDDIGEMPEDFDFAGFDEVLAEKLELIRKLEAGAWVSRVCDEYGVKKQTVSDIRKAKDKLIAFSLKYNVDATSKSSSVGARKSMRVAKDTNFEVAVTKWFVQQRSCGNVVRGVEIQAAAVKLASHMGIENFEASDGWLWRFRNRHGMCHLPKTTELTYGTITSYNIALPHQVTCNPTPTVESARFGPCAMPITPLSLGCTVQLVFGFEYAILLTVAINIAVKYICHAVDLQSENPWENKAMYLLYTELCMGFFKVVLYAVFMVIMIRIHTFPLFIIRPMYLTMR
ncbi:E3 ubiquitin-protein ligase synoviolin-like 1 [Homarus americanus]|uniref:E3 ubiquitin-protein ligase synoviolin-like 1 n=1 Tax=Homarus americanus TaxID=6706 RepID=A0A8J5MMZ2_HOMAM|nr:E3 ubiquitin-protein ligase synoviolin-like 1 [Homarus americanus]